MGIFLLSIQKNIIFWCTGSLSGKYPGHLIGHIGCSGSVVFGVSNVDYTFSQVYVLPCQIGDFTESQATMEC